MKVKFYKSVLEEINLPEDAVNEVTINRLKQFLNGGEYLREEKGKTWLKQDDPDWRHGSVSEVVVREATELDIAVFKVLKALKEAKK